jgi:hypothetical protein
MPESVNIEPRIVAEAMEKKMMEFARGVTGVHLEYIVGSQSWF